MSAGLRERLLARADRLERQVKLLRSMVANLDAAWEPEMKHRSGGH